MRLVVSQIEITNNRLKTFFLYFQKNFLTRWRGHRRIGFNTRDFLNDTFPYRWIFKADLLRRIIVKEISLKSREF